MNLVFDNWQKSVTSVPRQDNTRHDKAWQDKARRGQTRQDKAAPRREGVPWFWKILYIADLLLSYDPPWKLRLTDYQFLSQPPCRLKSYGDRVFCCAALVALNNILHSVKTATTVDSFKMKLKTHFIESHLHNDMWLYFNRDKHWLTLCLEQL